VSIRTVEQSHVCVGPTGRLRSQIATPHYCIPVVSPSVVEPKREPDPQGAALCFWGSGAARICSSGLVVSAKTLMAITWTFKKTAMFLSFFMHIYNNFQFYKRGGNKFLETRLKFWTFLKF
jgi:hypothetical protein